MCHECKLNACLHSIPIVCYSHYLCLKISTHGNSLIASGSRHIQSTTFHLVFGFYLVIGEVKMEMFRIKNYNVGKKSPLILYFLLSKC